MKSSLLLPLCIILTSHLCAQVPDSSSALFRMREAELDFARASVMYGRNTAFSENFAKESVIFTNRWITNGKQFSMEQKASPIVLKWEPEFMDISESRDFGISTGPWEVQEFRPNTAPVATGYYLTVWKRQPDGVWKVILDGGSETPVQKASLHKFLFPEGADKAVINAPVIDRSLSRKEILDTEKQSFPAEGMPSSFFTAFFDRDARVLLRGHLPSTDRDSIDFWISKLDNSLIWSPEGAEAASSGDMGFTYGIMEKQTDPGQIKGHYVRIWKRKAGSGWKIVLEMININPN